RGPGVCRGVSRSLPREAREGAAVTAPAADVAPAAPPASPWTPCRVLVWAQVACAAALLVHRLSILRPPLGGDDWQIVVESWTWDKARANLWLPHNEHSMPLGRVAIWLMALAADKPTNAPLVFALQGPLALPAAMLLVYVLVRREAEQPFLAL